MSLRVLRQRDVIVPIWDILLSSHSGMDSVSQSDFQHLEWRKKMGRDVLKEKKKLYGFRITTAVKPVSIRL